ncbi:MAG: hypothetical protein WD801_11425 [Gemmatimonadaceae bacterium]
MKTHILLLAAMASVATSLGAQDAPAAPDPRVGLRAGWTDAGQAIRNLTLVAHRERPAAFVNVNNPGDFGVANADLAFSGNRLFLGGFHGVQIWDITHPADPRVRSTIVCPGGQGDVSVHGHLLFMSVEETRGRVDCGAQGVEDTVSAARFRGVRIFDVRNIDRPVQVAAVQTCRGSHTHTLVTDPRDASHVYVYVAGTSPVRPAAELAGCSDRSPGDDTTTAYFRIEVIRVPLAAPANARIVNAPRIFADSTGNIAGLWAGGLHGPGTQFTEVTDQCHDITAYTEIGLAAGACSGNGILLDISDPASPRRVAEVTDPNFAYWHSATFSNDGSTVLFTDEWGGGVAPHCLATDRREWGANAIFERVGHRLRFASYYKLPAPQTDAENCVAHNGSLIPVPGRDIMAQAWYQGGISVFDFTDPARPFEIAFFDRGPMDTTLVLGGYWSTYWYNGHIYASEIGRGLDVFTLAPSEFLSENEIAAAALVRDTIFNAQNQTPIVWPARFVVARAYLDGLVRSDGLRRSWTEQVDRELTRAEALRGAPRRAALTELAARIDRDAATASDAKRVRNLAAHVRRLSAASP